MKVIHIMQDGTRLDSVKDKIVGAENAEIYACINRINEARRRENEQKKAEEE